MLLLLLLLFIIILTSTSLISSTLCSVVLSVLCLIRADKPALLHIMKEQYYTRIIDYTGRKNRILKNLFTLSKIFN